jgi:hypothetical protein
MLSDFGSHTIWNHFKYLIFFLIELAWFTGPMTKL